MLKPIAFALAAALSLLLGAQPASAAPKGPPIAKEQIAQGMKDAPPLVPASGVPCTLDQAAYVGEAPGKDANGKDIKNKVYEVSCKEGLGYEVIATQPKPTAIDCVSLLTAPVTCRLAGNADPKAGLAPIISKTGQACDVADAMGRGSTASGVDFIEVSCKGALGYVLRIDPAAAPTAVGCATLLGQQLECKLTTTDQIKTAERALLNRLIASSGKTCQISDTRTIGPLTSGSTAYEVKCAAGDGYVLMAKPDGSLNQAIGCANAGPIAGGCTLTNAVEAQTAETTTYTRLAKASGFNCDVAKYNFLGVDASKSEVVELACSNRADGGIAFFPEDNSPGHVIDCVKAGTLHQTCHLSDTTMFNEKYSQALASKGKSSCKVSQVRGLASTTDGDDFIETACSDGLPGWVLKMTPSGAVADLLTCGQVRASGLMCSLPGNTK